MTSAHDGYEISTDRERLDLDAIHAFLAIDRDPKELWGG